MVWSTWHNDEAKTWNVVEAEHDIRNIKYHANHFDNPQMAAFVKNTILTQLYKEDKLRNLVIAAAQEMSDIMKNKDNDSGYHLNHVVSSKTVFSLWNNNGKVYAYAGEYDTVEKAQEEAAKFDDAYVEPMETNDGTKFMVQAFDKEETERLRDDEYGGEFVGDFDTEEEAEAEGASLDRYYIVEMPKEEWWTVVKNKTNKVAYAMFFPTEVRALAFLYKVAKPRAWMEYVDYRCKKEGDTDVI